MAASVKVMAVAIVTIICSASLIGQIDADIVVKNQSKATNVSVHDLTLGLIIKNLVPTHDGRFSEISQLNQDLFKIVNLITNETLTKQFFGINTTVIVLDDAFGDVSILVKLESRSA